MHGAGRCTCESLGGAAKEDGRKNRLRERGPSGPLFFLGIDKRAFWQKCGAGRGIGAELEVFFILGYAARGAGGDIGGELGEEIGIAGAVFSIKILLGGFGW